MLVPIAVLTILASGNIACAGGGKKISSGADGAATVGGGKNLVAGIDRETLPQLSPAIAGLVDVHGVLFGHPFLADEALINSISLVLRQKHKAYNKVTINFAPLHTKLPDQEFFSKGKLQPLVEISQRQKNGEKIRTASFSRGSDDFGMHIKFGPRQQTGELHREGSTDTTSGAIIMRFKNGDYVSGTFCARQSPRLIWDDETIQ